MKGQWKAAEGQWKGNERSVEDSGRAIKGSGRQWKGNERQCKGSAKAVFLRVTLEQEVRRPVLLQRGGVQLAHHNAAPHRVSAQPCARKKPVQPHAQPYSRTHSRTAARTHYNDCSWEGRGARHLAEDAVQLPDPVEHLGLRRTHACCEDGSTSREGGLSSGKRQGLFFSPGPRRRARCRTRGSPALHRTLVLRTGARARAYMPVHLCMCLYACACMPVPMLLCPCPGPRRGPGPRSRRVACPVSRGVRKSYRALGSLNQ